MGKTEMEENEPTSELYKPANRISYSVTNYHRSRYSKSPSVFCRINPFPSMMNVKYVSLFTCLFLFPLLSITCGSSIRSSLTAEENSHPFLIRKIDSNQQQYTENGDPFQDTTQESQIEDTSNTAPLMSENEEIFPVLEEEKGSDKNIVLVNPRKVKSSSVAVAPIAPNSERRLYYPSAPVDQPKYRYHFTNNNTPLRSFDSAPLQPKQMGFPPISNTRENLGKQINWNAKVGRAHRSFYDLMTA